VCSLKRQLNNYLQIKSCERIIQAEIEEMWNREELNGLVARLAVACNISVLHSIFFMGFYRLFFLGMADLVR
jgi:hypothetical protein